MELDNSQQMDHKEVVYMCISLQTTVCATCLLLKLDGIVRAVMEL